MNLRLTGDNLFKALAIILAASGTVILIANGYTLLTGSFPVLQRFGTYFLIGTKWNPPTTATEFSPELYGALPYLLGTIVTSAIALLIGVPLSLGIAIFLVEMAPKAIKVPISYLVDLLAAVPSVIYGLWALYVLRFWLIDYIETPLSHYLGWFPLFSGSPHGLDLLNGGIILAIMVIPTVSSVSREVIQAVPNGIREAGYSIGATRWEVIRNWVLSYGRSGIFGAVILGLGRAIGETMAVTMVIGNATGPAAIPTSLFLPSQTLSSLIANTFSEATGLELSAVLGLGLLLFFLSLSTNIIAQVMVTRVLRVKGGAVE
jgi:phosphate transport system permease protein